MPDPATPNKPSNEPTFKERLEAFKDMVIIFRFERTLFLILGVLAVLILLGFAVLSLLKADIKWVTFSGMFGSSGAVGYCTARLWYQWDDGMVLLGLKKPKKGK